MNIKICITVDVEPAAWIELAGLDPNARARDVVQDIRTTVLHTVQQLHLVEDTGASVELAR